MLPTQTPITQPLTAIIIKKIEKPVEQLYTIQENDSLTKVAEATHTTVERLWEKNTDLPNPDLLEPSKTLKIPQDDEKLVDRPLPVPVIVEVGSSQTVTTPRPTLIRSGGVFVSMGDSSGNLYSPGYCTYYAKQMRPDLPNNLGNADTWASRAAAQGFSVSDSPTVGSVGVAKGYMHVAYVQSINPNGTINISEENYVGFGVVSSRTALSSEFNYIH